MSIRTDRASGLIRKEIALMLLGGEIHDPRLSGMVSITDVEMSRDLQYATVYFTMYGGELEDGLKGLNSSAGFIRRQLGRRLKMRRVPELRFKADHSMEQGEKIDRLLNSIDIPPPQEGDE
ncbi:MAG: 30S ribosome-binding factor RbfA [Magnetococcales bacterium]|nr:30S ribosome-binding factor RbfA [Magnetococcales bacterium]